MGLKGHGLAMPVDVVNYFPLRTQHQALRGLLYGMAKQLESPEVEKGEIGSGRFMRESLEDGKYVWDEAAMLAVALFGEKVSMNVIMVVTTMEALSVTRHCPSLEVCPKLLMQPKTQ